MREDVACAHRPLHLYDNNENAAASQREINGGQVARIVVYVCILEIRNEKYQINVL